MVNSRAKGNRAEREVCKILREALGGSWERKSMGIPGPDLLCPDWFEFSVEVKDDKSVHAIHFFHPSTLLEKYWQQCSAQADSLDKLPLLVAKVEHHWFCCTEWCTWQKLDDWLILYRKRRAGAK